MVADAIDEAIAAVTEPQPVSVRMTQFAGTMDATGRPFQIVVPADMTDVEALSIVRVILDLRDAMERQRAQGAAARIIVPGR